MYNVTNVNVTKKGSHHLPVCDVTELLQPVLNATDGLFYSCALKPVVVFIWPLRIQTAALA